LEIGKPGGVSSQNVFNKESVAFIFSEVVKAFQEKGTELPSVPENSYQQITGESIIAVYLTIIHKVVVQI